MEQTKAQEDQAASITRSAEWMMNKLATEGFFSYLPSDKGDIEQTIIFDTILEDCDTNKEFVNAIFLLYREIKKPLSEPVISGETGRAITFLIHVVENMAMKHVAFCANDEHGVS